jgi:hypothetical protein
MNQPPPDLSDSQSFPHDPQDLNTFRGNLPLIASEILNPSDKPGLFQDPQDIMIQTCVGRDKDRPGR